MGSARTIHVDVRLIAATHRDLQAMIQKNQFREDLFYRLNVFPIEIPPLRERREDIPLLVNFFVSRLSRKMQKNIESIPKDAMDALTNAAWPGNIRELENLVKRYVILGNEEVISSDLVSQEQEFFNPEINFDGPISLKKITRQATRELERKIDGLTVDLEPDEKSEREMLVEKLGDFLSSPLGQAAFAAAS